MFNKQDSRAEGKGYYGNITSLHRAFIEHSIIIRLSEPHLYIRTDAFTLSGFTTAFKVGLNERNSTGHRVAYIIKTSLMH